MPDLDQHDEELMYELLTVLGTSGLRTVYKARQRQSNRLVALKVIHSNLPAAHLEKQRLFREGRSMASARHPRVLDCYGVGEQEGWAYLAMELAEGPTLTQTLDGPWSACEAAQVVELVACALHHVHEVGLIHRGIGPQHIWLGKDRKPKLGGFRLARCLTGENDNESTATDLYALGTVLYDLLTAPAGPAGCSTSLTSLDAKNDPAVALSFPPSVPPELERICVKCLGKDPAQAYSTSAALAEDLHRFFEGQVR